MNVIIGNEIHEVEITRKKIRNMYLRVDAEGTLHVSCSPRTTQKQIENFLLSKADWILKTQKKQEKRADRVHTGTDGQITWMGKRYPCEIVLSSRGSTERTDRGFLLHVRRNTPEEIERVFYAYAAKQLAVMLESLRLQWDREICTVYRKPKPSLTVRYMTGRWGSCTPDKASIRISTRLIHYPAVCLEYVLLHEYVHLLVHNHSAEFYRTVARYMPSYREAEALLK